jgi:hypothetical protein
VRLVGCDGASRCVREDGTSGIAARLDAMIVQLLVVPGAEQNEVDEFRRAATLDCDHVMRLQFACGGTPGVLAVA